MMCRVTFIACGVPSLYDLDLFLRPLSKCFPIYILQYLTIAPIRGNLKPGESMMCRVTFIACGVPSFYDLDLVCEVGESDLLLYKTDFNKFWNIVSTNISQLCWIQVS